MPLPFGLPLGRARLRSSRAQNAAVPLRIRSRKSIHFRALELPGSECFGSLEDSIKKVNLFELRSPQAQHASVPQRIDAFRALELPGSECFGFLEDSVKKVIVFELRSSQAQNAAVSLMIQ